MKKVILITMMIAITLCASAQNAAQARKILDKTSAVIAGKGGASANFKISGNKTGTATGTIAIKGNKFHARTAKAIVWYNGKTQWSYLKSTNEVNVTTPTEAQRMQMNPYAFISMYKSGYTLGMTQKGNNYTVHMKAQNAARSVQEVYLTIDKKSYKPNTIKMREGQQWTTITITNFKTQHIADNTFTFNAKEFPSAEVIDLR